MRIDTGDLERPFGLLLDYEMVKFDKDQTVALAASWGPPEKNFLFWFVCLIFVFICC